MRLLVAAYASMSVGCTTAGEPVEDGGATADAHTDAMELTEGSCDFELVLGQGIEAFEPCESGLKTLVLERGNQGLQHVIVSVRAPIRGGFHPLSLALWQEGDPAPLVESTLSVPWGLAQEGLSQVLGVLLVIESPETIIDRPLRLEARVSPDGEGVGCATMPVEVRW